MIDENKNVVTLLILCFDVMFWYFCCFKTFICIKRQLEDNQFLPRVCIQSKVGHIIFRILFCCPDFRYPAGCPKTSILNSNFSFFSPFIRHLPSDMALDSFYTSSSTLTISTHFFQLLLSHVSIKYPSTMVMAHINLKSNIYDINEANNKAIIYRFEISYLEIMAAVVLKLPSVSLDADRRKSLKTNIHIKNCIGVCLKCMKIFSSLTRCHCRHMSCVLGPHLWRSPLNLHTILVVESSSFCFISVV